jgi:hypothetical protein
MISKPEYRVSVKIPRPNCFNYEVNFADGRKGSAQIMFFPAHIFDFTFLYDQLLKEGLKPNAVLTLINSFYPNGDLDSKNEKDMLFMRQGVGSAVLERVVKDSVDYGASAMYGSIVSLSMARFLRKNGFTAHGDESFYKLLKD